MSAGAAQTIAGVAFSTVTAALSGVTASGTVIVNGGTYLETVSVSGTRTLEITGPDSAQAVTIEDLASIAGAFLGVWFDLGHMGRAYRILTAPSFTSMMAFNAWMYMAFGVTAVVAWALSYRAGSTWLKPVLCLGIFFAVLFPSQSGAFFGVVDAKPYWHNALLPVLSMSRL